MPRTKNSCFLTVLAMLLSGACPTDFSSASRSDPSARSAVITRLNRRRSAESSNRTYNSPLRTM
jgi:hypothetical protein